MNSPYIVFADDDPDDRDALIQPFLEKNPGVSVMAFSDGGELLRYLEDCPSANLPVMILMDYKMPFGTAADILEHLSADPRYSEIVKLVWSTSGRPEYVDRCVEKGAAQYFTKPVSLPELTNIVDRLTGAFRTRMSTYTA